MIQDSMISYGDESLLSNDDLSSQTNFAENFDPLADTSQESNGAAKNFKGKIDKKIIESTLNNVLTMDDVFQYCWPPENLDGKNEEREYWMIQENLANFMQIKGFKRRYPDLFRRNLQAQEADWLVQEKHVSKEFADLGLTALKAEEVMDLFQRDFPEYYSNLHELFSRRKVREIAERQKRQYQAARIERSGIRAENARKKAIQCVKEFNRDLIRSRIRERRYYWDLQTMQIHVPRKTINKYEDRPDRSKLDYPVAVIPGQYSDYFRTYTPEHLKFLPLTHAVYLNPMKKPLRIPRIANYDLKFSKVALEARKKEEEARTRQNEFTEAAAKALEIEKEKERLQNQKQVEIPQETVKTQGSESLDEVKSDTHSVSELICGPPIKCTTCNQMTQYYVKCSECTKQGHPKCLQLPDSMVEVVKEYQWNCIDCRNCTECEDSGNEDLMMFCDRCDRGFHAFCVGLKSIPDGYWACPLCTGEPCASPLPKPNTNSRNSSRKTPASASRKRKGTSLDDDTSYNGRGTPSSKRRSKNWRKGSITKSSVIPLNLE